MQKSILEQTPPTQPLHPLTMKTISIPTLGSDALSVLESALAFDCAGMPLRFHVVFEGEWQFNRLANKFEKASSIRGVPVIERVEGDTFDGWLMSQIAAGMVTIAVESGSYRKELHRSTARRIPLEPVLK